MTNRFMKRCSISLIVMEVQITATHKHVCQLLLDKFVKIKNMVTMLSKDQLMALDQLIILQSYSLMSGHSSISLKILDLQLWYSPVILKYQEVSAEFSLVIKCLTHYLCSYVLISSLHNHIMAYFQVMLLELFTLISYENN